MLGLLLAADAGRGTATEETVALGAVAPLLDVALGRLAVDRPAPIFDFHAIALHRHVREAVRLLVAARITDRALEIVRHHGRDRLNRWRRCSALGLPDATASRAHRHARRRR